MFITSSQYVFNAPTASFSFLFICSCIIWWLHAILRFVPAVHFAFFPLLLILFFRFVTLLGCGTQFLLNHCGRDSPHVNFTYSIFDQINFLCIHMHFDWITYESSSNILHAVLSLISALWRFCVCGYYRRRLVVYPHHQKNTELNSNAVNHNQTTLSKIQIKKFIKDGKMKATNILTLKARLGGWLSVDESYMRVQWNRRWAAKLKVKNQKSAQIGLNYSVNCV